MLALEVLANYGSKGCTEALMMVHSFTVELMTDLVRIGFASMTHLRRAPWKARFPSGRQTHPATFAPAGSNRSSRGGNEAAEASDEEGHFGDSASMRVATCCER